ncbi:MAG: hypothetical protein DRN15_06710 [Thermoprotei archaeon]|nr:MAG: hypothetical protein DRN15_06710 [Thermoprotei archaeon]
MPKVIEWINPREDEIIWRYPDEVIEWGSQLIVHEYEVAIFMRDGKLYDVFGPGRHTITTLALPLLTKVLSKVAGFDKIPFRATVIFVSLKQFQGKFGGRTQTRELAPLMFHGTYWFRVADPKLFLVEVVGGQSLYDSTSVSRFLRGYFNEHMMKYLSSYSIYDVFRNLDRVSMEVKVKLMDDFRRIGLELVDVKFEGVDTTDEWRQRIFWLRQMGPEAAAYVLQMDTLRSVAKELGKSPGAAVGAGVAIIPPLAYPPAAPAVTPPTRTCPRCKRPVPPDAKFCPYCGQALVAQRCPGCGREVPPGAAYCPYCGRKVS